MQYDIGVYVLVVRTICYRLVAIYFVHEVVATMMPYRWFHKLTRMEGQAVVPDGNDTYFYVMSTLLT